MKSYGLALFSSRSSGAVRTNVQIYAIPFGACPLFLFRRWATTRLREYLVKGFVMDDERLKEGRSLGADYFDELLERIRDIRASEKKFYHLFFLFRKVICGFVTGVFHLISGQKSTNYFTKEIFCKVKCQIEKSTDNFTKDIFCISICWGATKILQKINIDMLASF